MSQLVHAQRGRLYRLARREGLRDQDAFDCVQDAFHTFLLLPQARRLVGSNDDSMKLLSAMVRNHARNRRRKHAISRPHDSSDETLALVAADTQPVEELIARAEDFSLMLG
jgi:RNA polymerase sigma-70 factor (ECF subfamily)